LGWTTCFFFGLQSCVQFFAQFNLGHFFKPKGLERKKIFFKNLKKEVIKRGYLMRKKK